MNAHPLVMPSVAQYDAAFKRECEHLYPDVKDFEVEQGARIEKAKLEAAARILACPVKSSPPNWQHGRVLYAAARRYLASCDEPVRFLDIGTAKGFSALVLQWALLDAGKDGRVESVDVIDPLAKVFRNSVADVGRENRLADYLRDWPEASLIRFYQSTGVDWLLRSKERVHLAFVDGKHTADAVAKEGALLAARQVAGDVVVFDDMQMVGVGSAVNALAKHYVLTRIDLETAKRSYAVGVRR